jgi:FixJ family two-component response regulator
MLVAGMKPRILIVDDDPGTLASLSRAFALEGYTALTASSGARALERLADEPVDAVLSDVVMPEMDGLDFLARLKERAPEVPVILMSGQASVETAVKATRMGALDFVEKPVGLDRLLLTLRNALRLDRLQRENRELQRNWREELALRAAARRRGHLRARGHPRAPQGQRRARDQHGAEPEPGAQSPVQEVQAAGDRHPGGVAQSGRPSRPATEMSSSMSGQWIPVPDPISRQLFRCSGVASRSRGNHSIGTLSERPSAKCTTSAAGPNSIPRARACGGLTREVFIPTLQEGRLVFQGQLAYSPQLGWRELA